MLSLPLSLHKQNIHKAFLKNSFCLSLSRNVLLAGSIRWEVVLDDGALRDEEEEKDIEKGLDFGF